VVSISIVEMQYISISPLGTMGSCGLTRVCMHCNPTDAPGMVVNGLANRNADEIGKTLIWHGGDDEDAFSASHSYRLCKSLRPQSTALISVEIY